MPGASGGCNQRDGGSGQATWPWDCEVPGHPPVAGCCCGGCDGRTVTDARGGSSAGAGLATTFGLGFGFGFGFSSGSAAACGGSGSVG
jgi:hypothetical protein